MIQQGSPIAQCTGWFLTWGNLRGSHQELAAQTTAAEKTWAGTGAAAAEPLPPMYERSP